MQLTRQAHGNANAFVQTERNTIIKYFDEHSLDGRKRFAREVKYYEFLNKSGLDFFAPKFLGASAFTKVRLEHIKNAYPPSKDEFFLAFKIFLKHLLQEAPSPLVEKLPLAKEAMIHPRALQKALINRFEFLVNKNIIPKHDARLLYTFIEKCNSSVASEHIIASPSDIGPHNCLMTKNKLLFFDFEYAGRDSILKMLMDLLMHPSLNIRFEEEQTINNFTARLFDNNDIVAPITLRELTPSFAALWILRLFLQIHKLKNSNRSNSQKLINTRENVLLRYQKYLYGEL